MAVATDRYLLAILTSLLIMVVFAAERLISVKNRREVTDRSNGDADPGPKAEPDGTTPEARLTQTRQAGS